MGVDPVPNRWTIQREIARAGLAKPRRRQPGYVPQGVPYPNSPAPEPGTIHQIDMVGPRHLHRGVEFHALNLINDVGSHEAANEILEAPRPNLLAAGLVAMWSRVGVPQTAQFDNHSNFRGGIPPAYAYFGPVVAACLDLGVTARFIPLREPWRNGVIEHFNDVWDKSFFVNRALQWARSPASGGRRLHRVPQRRAPLCPTCSSARSDRTRVRPRSTSSRAIPRRLACG